VVRRSVATPPRWLVCVSPVLAVPPVLAGSPAMRPGWPALLAPAPWPVPVLLRLGSIPPVLAEPEPDGGPAGGPVPPGWPGWFCGPVCGSVISPPAGDPAGAAAATGRNLPPGVIQHPGSTEYSYAVIVRRASSRDHHPWRVNAAGLP
jgi:hypothetical protein